MGVSMAILFLMTGNMEEIVQVMGAIVTRRIMDVK